MSKIDNKLVHAAAHAIRTSATHSEARKLAEALCHYLSGTPAPLETPISIPHVTLKPGDRIQGTLGGSGLLKVKGNVIYLTNHVPQLDKELPGTDVRVFCQAKGKYAVWTDEDSLKVA